MAPGSFTAIPATMRAWTRPVRGPAAKVLKLTDGLPTPKIAPSSNDVLVRVSHISVQWSMEWVMSTMPALPALPGAAAYIPELEFSGTVAAAGSAAPAEVREVGAKVQGFKGIADSLFFGRGALAEYVSVPGSQLVRLADDADMATAGGMVAPGTTALKILRVGALQGTDKVLVNGASSSVGSTLIQMCKLKGMTVVGM